MNLGCREPKVVKIDDIELHVPSENGERLTATRNNREMGIVCGPSSNRRGNSNENATGPEILGAVRPKGRGGIQSPAREPERKLRKDFRAMTMHFLQAKNMCLIRKAEQKRPSKLSGTRVG